MHGFRPFRRGLSHKYIILISITVLYYEYCQTLAREVAYVWHATPQFTAINILFYLNRYTSVLAPIGFVLQALWLPTDYPNKLQVRLICPCMRLSSFHVYISVFVQFVVGVFLVMRTYALYNGNRWILGVLVASAGAVLANGIYSVTSGSSQAGETADSLLDFHGCIFPMTSGEARKHATAWSGLLALDLLIFVLTLYKSIAEIRYGGSPIMRVLLRDGSCLCLQLIMSLFTSLTIVTYLAFGPYYHGNFATITNTCAYSALVPCTLTKEFLSPYDSLSSVMMARLLLNLRDPSLCCRSRYVPGSTTISHQQRVSWTDVITVSIDETDEEHQHTDACRARNQDSGQWTTVSQGG
ncbi:hypothetical protein NMY22_g9852 [Coprinellus aureogranulatus]|nr:hypothetical protein NMY22_g9852 [Coprinellus aureogranulatus]